MDVPLGLFFGTFFGLFVVSLNPCYSGCASRLMLSIMYQNLKFSLNPCYSGCASRLRKFLKQCTPSAKVLILVIVDVPLGCTNVYVMIVLMYDLIIVILDLPLGLDQQGVVHLGWLVLILVIVDVPLGYKVLEY